MMEILHKAKRIDTGEWVIGYYNKRHGVYGEVDFMFWSNAYNHWDNVEIDPKTVCVYIGLEDESKKDVCMYHTHRDRTHGRKAPIEKHLPKCTLFNEWLKKDYVKCESCRNACKEALEGMKK